MAPEKIEYGLTKRETVTYNDSNVQIARVTLW